MAKFYGSIGFAETVEIEPGLWTEGVVEHSYFGDLTRNSGKFQTSNNVNKDIDISSEISIVADPYAMEHFHSIRYVEFMGAKWNVNSVEVKPPRLILTVGGVYNDGEQA